jgi:hypothetical protein
MTYSRRQFVRIVPALGAFAVPAFASVEQLVAQSLTSPNGLVAQPFRAADGVTQTPGEDPVWPQPEPARGTPVDDSFPSLHIALAKEIVGVSHSNLARVRELVQQHPALAKASFDWGYGDAETALGAASHVGRREIAELLIENGAPPTLFSATMLGQLDVVKALIAATPGAQRMRGPHSISLLTHAKIGGPKAESVLKYLESLGDADQPLTSEPLAPEDRAQLDGRYSFGARPRDTFTVITKPNQVGIVRVGATERFLTHLGSLAFHPPGAPAVRIRFEREGTKVVALTLSDPDLVVRARKVG